MTTTATAPEPTVDTVEIVPSFIRDSWWTPDAASAAGAAPVLDASTGELLAKVSTEGLDLAAVVDYGRTTGQAELGKLTFHQRALKLKELAQYLNGRREEFYALSAQTGATKIDSMIDIDGGIGVLFTFGSKGRRELPELPGGGGRPHGGAVQGRLLRRRAHLHPHPRRRRADQRLQLPGLGHAREARPGLHRRRAPPSSSPPPPPATWPRPWSRRSIESGILPEGSLQLISGSVRDPAGPPATTATSSRSPAPPPPPTR